MNSTVVHDSSSYVCQNRKYASLQRSAIITPGPRICSLCFPFKVFCYSEENCFSCLIIDSGVFVCGQWIKEINSKKRIQYGRVHLHWTIHGHWKKVISSDEITSVIKSKGRTEAWRRKEKKSEKWTSQCLEGTSLLVWKTHLKWWFEDVLFAMVSVLWCLWQEIWTELNTSMYWVQTGELLLPGILAENYGPFKTAMPRFTDLLKTGSKGMTFHVFSDHPWAQIWTRRKMCGMCWKMPWERAFCRINTDLDFQCAQLFPGIQCLTFSSSLCTSLCQDDVSTFSKWRDTLPDIEVIARTLNKN